MDADDAAGRYGEDMFDSMDWLDDEIAGIERRPAGRANDAEIGDDHDIDSESGWEDDSDEEQERTETVKRR